MEDRVVASQSVVVRVWNETVAPKFVRFRHVLVNGLGGCPVEVKQRQSGGALDAADAIAFHLALWPAGSTARPAIWRTRRTTRRWLI